VEIAVSPHIVAANPLTWSEAAPKASGDRIDATANMEKSRVDRTFVDLSEARGFSMYLGNASGNWRANVETNS
jgi:hypothetical protein